MRDRLSPKIRNFLLAAKSYKLDWAWADTCCIDRTSSAELSEAVNSMFLYYSSSEVCIAYLNDVCPTVTQGDMPEDFGRSMWHKRGWTLLELVAPKVVAFMAKDWTHIGTKYQLADAMEKAVEGCPPASVLRFEKEIRDMSVAQRMSWAAGRKTTRVEDEAYCLFGLFDVNMPTLYGEGRNAFYRLQEEIMRTSTDTSLFAWHLDIRQLRRLSLTQLEEEVTRLDEHYERRHRDNFDDFGCLFASSPSDFGSSRITPAKPWESDPSVVYSVSGHVV